MMHRNKKRLLYLSPSVISGAQPEPKVTDFQSLTKNSIGQGAFGEVYSVRHKTSGNLYAIKVVNKQKVIQANLVSQLRRQVRIMYSLDHPHIIKLHNHFEDDKNVYIVLQLALGGTIFQKLAKFKSFDESTAAQYIREVILALEYLHSMDPPIIHRDIKPQNLLLDKQGRDGRVKLADFGWSNFFNEDLTRMTYCGTLEYLAPEMIQRQGHSTSLDIWNLGVLLFELLCGHAPFQAKSQPQLFEKILKVKINFPKNFSPQAKDLISKLLKARPVQRISLQEMKSHSWFAMHPPIRPTITQYLTETPLPCDLEHQEPEVAVQDPIKPFKESEIRVISQPVEQSKEIVIPVVEPAAYKQQIVKLENELKMNPGKDRIKTNLENKEEELKNIQQKIEDFKVKSKKLQENCELKKKIQIKLREKLSEKTNKITELKSCQEDQNTLYQQFEALRAKSLQKDTQNSLLKAQIENMQKVVQQRNQQSLDLDKQISALKAQIQDSKQNSFKQKAEMHEQLLKLTTDVDLLQQELKMKQRDNSAVSVQSLINFSRENLEMLISKQRGEEKLIKQFQSSSEQITNLNIKFTQMKLEYEKDLKELRSKTQGEIRGLEECSSIIRQESTDTDMDILQRRLRESRENKERNQKLFDTVKKLREQVSLYEKWISLNSRHVKDLEFLKKQDEKLIYLQDCKIKTILQDSAIYKRKLSLSKL